MALPDKDTAHLSLITSISGISGTSWSHFSRHGIFFNRVIVLIRAPGFLQLPRAGLGGSGEFAMVNGGIAFFQQVIEGCRIGIRQLHGLGSGGELIRFRPAGELALFLQAMQEEVG